MLHYHDMLSPPLTYKFQQQRRRAQNRDSQRAYRQRKEQRIEELEQQLSIANAEYENLSTAYQQLRTELDSMSLHMYDSSDSQTVADESAGYVSSDDVVPSLDGTASTISDAGAFDESPMLPPLFFLDTTAASGDQQQQQITLANIWDQVPQWTQPGHPAGIP
ncbi:hypothetical protein BX600DRAFT_54961 [Xylariales sp. PMI_506]|nr:hypothetical protein BX600DRAFT_54961 [Xylariales sp. PMI_506]